ncbi:hypothetical protein AB3S75_034289 [Citrus x aurantiifolia]
MERTGGNRSESSILGASSPLPSIPLHSIVSLAQLNNTGFASSPLRLSLLSIQLNFSLSILPLLFRGLEGFCFVIPLVDFEVRRQCLLELRKM